MDKQILTAVLMIGLVALAAGVGTYAYFSDSESSTGNTFAAGTMDLELLDANEGFGPPDSVTVTWNMSNMVPGVTTLGPRSVTLLNRGSLAANHVEINFSHSINDATDVDVESDTNPASTPGEMARWIRITLLIYDGVILTDVLSDLNNNSFLDLEDVTLGNNSAEGGPLDNLLVPPPLSGSTRTLTMALAFDAGATNDIQGDILNTTVTFTLNQHSSQ